MSRTSQIHRTTGETDVQLSLALDGSGQGRRETGVGFFDHLLDALARHGGLDLDGFLAALEGGSQDNSFLLTIDDGHESVARIAAQCEQRRGRPQGRGTAPFWNVVSAVEQILGEEREEPRSEVAHGARAYPR